MSWFYIAVLSPDGQILNLQTASMAAMMNQVKQTSASSTDNDEHKDSSDTNNNSHNTDSNDNEDSSNLSAPDDSVKFMEMEESTDWWEENTDAWWV